MTNLDIWNNLILDHFFNINRSGKLVRLNVTKEMIEFVEHRKGHDFRYAIDITKIKKILNWEPKTNFEQGIEITINYYLNKFLKRLEV